MRHPNVLLVILLAALVLGCGGGGGVPAAAADDGPIRIETGQAVLTLDPAGMLTSLVVSATGTEAVGPEPRSLLELDRAGATFTPDAVRRDGSDLVFTFPAGAMVRLAVDTRDGYARLDVAAVEPGDVEALRLCLGLRRLGSQSPPLDGTYDDEAIVVVRSTNAITRCDYRTIETQPVPGVEWTSRHGIVGGACAVVATARSAFDDAMSALEVAADLPSPRFDGVPARSSATARQSYFFLTYYRDGDLDALIDYARVGGFGSILLLRGIWRTSAGTYGIAPAQFPGGLAEFETFCGRIHDAGLGVGLHVYGPSISKDDPLVTPVPQDGLLAWDCPPLATAVGASDTDLVLASAPDLPAAAGAGFPGRYVRLGDEIIEYAEQSDGPPFVFTGCMRGALGTAATAHTQGVVPRHLATLNDLFLIAPDGPLVQAVSANLGAVVNQADIDMVYFDGTALVPTNDHVQRWYMMNRLLPAYDEAFDHDVIVQTGMGQGRELDWHMVPRSASADGHGDITWYLDQRTPAIETIRRGLCVPDVGWYGFDSGRPPEYLEYVAAKCLGWRCGISVQSHRLELEADRRARETMEILGRYERLKLDDSLPDATRAALLEPGRHVRLLEDASGFHLFDVDYDRAVDVRTLASGGFDLPVGNPNAEARALGIEVTRGDAIRVDADFSAPGTTTLDLFHDATPYVPGSTNDSARLLSRVDPVMNAAGPARSGVSHTFEIIPDASVGGQCAELAATNAGSSIGWCAVGRRFEAPLDVSGIEALGLWVRGDKSGIELTLELWDDADQRASFKLPLFFDGWRFFAVPFSASAAFDRTSVRYLVLIAADLPPGRDVSAAFVLLRGTPTVTPPADLTGVRLQVDERVIDLPVPLPPGGTARVDALGRLTVWPGGMEAGQTWVLPGGGIEIDPGVHTVRLEVGGDYPGDVTLRISRLVPLDTE